MRSTSLAHMKAPTIPAVSTFTPPRRPGKLVNRKLVHQDSYASEDSTYDGGSPKGSVPSVKVCWADMGDDDDDEAHVSFGKGVKSNEGPPMEDHNDDETHVSYGTPIAMPECKVLTLMITKLPASCTKDYLVKAMESLGFEGKQDYFMMPMNGSVHMGCAFIGFPHPDTTQQFAEHMAGFLLASPPGTSDDEKVKIIPSRSRPLVRDGAALLSWAEAIRNSNSCCSIVAQCCAVWPVLDCVAWAQTCHCTPLVRSGNKQWE